MSRKKNWIFLLFLIGILSYYFFLNPENDTQYFLGCPFREVTGYLCPGCGIQRAFHELLHFHFFKAFQLNGLFVLGIPYVLVLIFTGFQKEKFQNIRSFLLSPRTLWVLLMISILFGIIRNL